MPSKILDRFLPDVIDERKIRCLVDMKLVVPNELASLLHGLEIQSVPIEYRAAAKNQSNSLEIVQREVVDSLQPLAATWSGWRSTRMRRVRFVRRSQLPEFVLVTSSLDVRRRRDRVPKKMPNVNASTVSWAPYAPLDAKSTTGTAPSSR